MNIHSLPALARKRSATEDAIHFAIADLLRFKGDRRLIFYHCPNGEPRTGRSGQKLKRMGVRPGVADFCLVLPDTRAAFLEVKSESGRQSPEQRAFQFQCEELGVPYAVVRSSQEAEEKLWEWGALRGPAPQRRSA